MGCAGSKEDPKLLHDIEELKEYLRQQELKSIEQQNLLRFKMEVLVNMLAVEEKRSELTTKRLDTLKWLIHSQGVTEETITKILNSLEKDGKLSIDSSTFTLSNPNHSNSPFASSSIQLMDLSGAIERMREDFQHYSKDILHAYALENGKIIPNLFTQEFIEQTYNVTEKVSKIDLKVLAMRFDDGNGNVSITEFLEFFTTSKEKRNMKLAERAVKMSLDLFSLDVELLQVDEKEDEEVTEGENQLRKSILRDESLLYDDYHGPEMRKTHFTKTLDRGAKRLLVMWVYVRAELDKNFKFYQKAQRVMKDMSESKAPTPKANGTIKGEGIASLEGKESGPEVDDLIDDEEIVTNETFQKVLTEVCGKFSTLLEQLAKDGIIELSISSTPKPALLNTNANDPKSKALPQNKTTKPTPTNGKENKLPISPNAPTPSNKNVKPGSVPSTATTPKNTNPTSTPKSVSTGKTDTSLPSKPPLPQIIPLEQEDVLFLIDRFEISGFIHYHYFLEFFNDLYDRWMKYSKKFIHLPGGGGGGSGSSNNSSTKNTNTTSNPNTGSLNREDWMTSVSPFQLSSEWNNLKQTSLLRQSFQETREKSLQSISNSKERLATSKSFTAPKKLPPPSNTPASLPTEKKPMEEAVKEKPKEKIEVEKEKDKLAEPKDEKEPAVKDAKADKKEEKDAKKEEKKTAPIVEPKKGFFCCGGGSTKAKPLNNEPIDLSDSKNKGKKDAKDDKKGVADEKGYADGKKDLKIETDSIADGKDGEEDFVKLKRDDSFDTPKNITRKAIPKFDRFDSDGASRNIEREGLGHGDEPEIKDRTRRGRFRRRADRDFDQEKPELDDEGDVGGEDLRK